MKILTLSNSPLNEAQGSGYVIVNYVRGLQALGHEVECLGPSSYELWPGLGRARRWRLAFGMMLVALRRRLFVRFDLVEFYGAEAWLTVLLLRLVRTRCVLVQHSNGLETLHHLDMARNGGLDTLSGEARRWYQFRADRLLALSFTQVDALVLVSWFEYRFALSRRYQPVDRLLAIENPLPSHFLGQAIDLRRSLALGFCGAWIWRKGTDLLVASIDRLLAAHPEATFRIVGAGADFDPRTVFDPSVCERIVVTPFVSDKAALKRWYGSISILLVPSYSESFGLVSAEAMACGCAVVATPTGYAADLIDQEEAMVLAGFSAQKLTAAVETLLANDAMRERIARRGYERVQSLEWGRASAELESFYLACLNERRKGAQRCRHPATRPDHRLRP